MITTQREARAEFWRQHPDLDRRKIPHYSGKGTMYTTDTRVAFVDWIDYMSKSGQITDRVAQNVTLGG